jgi:hypothetical protein
MEDKINWFGTVKGKSKKHKRENAPLRLASQPNNLLFPGLKLKRKAPISFMHPVNVNSIFKKNRSSSLKSSEELLYGRNRLRKFGDWDMDGSPNLFDCSPKKVSQDGIVDWLKKRKETKRIKTKTKSIKKLSPTELLVKKKAERKKKTESFEEGIKDYRKLMKKEGLKVSIPKSEKEAIRTELTEKKMAATGRTTLSAVEKEEIEQKVKKAAKKYIPEGTKEAIASIQLAKEEKAKFDQFKEGGRYYGEKGAIRFREAEIAEKIAKGQKPTPKEFFKLQAAQERYKKEHPLAALKSGNIPSVESMRKVIKGGEWSGDANIIGRKVARTSAGILSAFLPSGTLTGRTYSNTGVKTGRPKGSFKYYIPGVGPVGVYEHREWARQQKSLQRAQGTLPEQSPEYQIQQQVLRQQQEQIEMSPQEEVTQEVNNNGAYIETSQPTPQRAPMSVKTTTPQFKDTKQMLQYQEQVTDIILNAPNLQRGDMVGTGHNIFTYTPPETNILNAPVITMGQMRNVENKGKEIPSVTLHEKGVSNPHGNEYTENDILSGQLRLRKRIEEKWLTGEAL